MTAIAYNTELTAKLSVWCLDSRATKHMYNAKHKFETFTDDVEMKIYTASEHFVKSTELGDVQLNLSPKDVIKPSH